MLEDLPSGLAPVRPETAYSQSVYSVEGSAQSWPDDRQSRAMTGSMYSLENSYFEKDDVGRRLARESSSIGVSKMMLSPAEIEEEGEGGRSSTYRMKDNSQVHKRHASGPCECFSFLLVHLDNGTELGLVSEGVVSDFSDA